MIQTLMTAKKPQGNAKETPKTKPKRATTTKKKATRAKVAATKAAQTKKNKADFIAAYEASLGSVTMAAKKAGVDRTTYYHWCKTDPEFKAACKEAIEMQKDFAESQLMKLIRDGDAGSIKFYLQTKGRDRGYGDKIEVTGADGKDLVPSICIEVIDPKA